MAVSVAESYSTDLTLAVPIFVLLIAAVDVTLIDEFGTQCNSTAAKWSIEKLPIVFDV